MATCHIRISLTALTLLACASPGLANQATAQCQAGDSSLACEETSLLQTRVMQGRDTDDLEIQGSDSAKNVVDCGNGNGCNEDEQCTTHKANAGRLYGCAPGKNTVCSDLRFSCDPADSKCDCSLLNATGKVLSTEAQDLVGTSSQSDSLCQLLHPSGACSCADQPQKESKLSCDVNIPSSPVTFGVEVDVKPCATPASVTVILDVAGAKIPIGPVDADHPAHVPIPGVNLNIGIASVGLILDVEVSGNADQLNIDIGINGCASWNLPWIGKQEACGNDIPGIGSSLPYKIVRETIPISSYCTSFLSQTSQQISANKTVAVNVTW